MSRLSTWLQSAFFPKVVAYATHPVVITLTMLLLIPLVFDSSNTALALTLGNYTNVVSASVASIVLLQQLAHHTENRRHNAAHAQQIADLHAKIDALTASPPPNASAEGQAPL